MAKKDPTPTSTRRIEYLPLDDIRANPANPKGHDVDTINGSVHRFGYIDSVAVDARTGYLISGHGRTKTLRAMKARGDAPPDGIQVDQDGAWLVPVQVGWSSRDDTEAAGALISLNRTTELGGWVDESLLDLLDVIDDYTGVGFTGGEVEDLRRKLEELGDEPAPGPGAGGGPPPFVAKDLAGVEELVTLHHGDCIEVLRTLPDASVDAVVTDPPYNLSDSGKRDAYCLSKVIADFALPEDYERDAEASERGDLPHPATGATDLRRVDGAIGVDPRVSVPEGAVHLERAAVVEHEVNARDVAAMSATDWDLATVADDEPVELGGDYVLKVAHRRDAAFCDGTCSCFTEPRAGVIAVTVVVPQAARGDGSGDGLVIDRSDAYVRVDDDAAGESESSPAVLAGGGAVHRAVLRLDVRSGTGELDLADSTAQGHAIFELRRAQPIRAGARAGGLTPVSKPHLVRLVGGATDRTFTVHSVSHAAKSTGGFMGKEWDGWESPASFQRWCQAWAAECLRVLKPGGHMLAFGGSRTWHRLAAAVEDVGFEIRDSIAWLYGSGFPKSLDVSKAIDKAAGAEREVVGKGYRVDRKTGAVPYGSGTPDGVYDLTAPATRDAAQWEGWGTALKPAFEPIVVGRKPFTGTVAANVLEYGTGALNIDGCRVGDEERVRTESDGTYASANSSMAGHNTGRPPAGVVTGRWPANIALDESQAAELDRQGGDDDAGASRFFPTFRYEAKAPTSERPREDDIVHPTVKPVDLMRWLVRLVTPPGGVVLEPFAGSGTTLEAAVLEGFACIGIEREASYLPLIRQRLGLSGDAGL